MNFKKASVEELIQEYEQAARDYERALKDANSRRANRAHDRILDAYRELRGRAATSRLLQLLGSDSDNVRGSVAVHALEFAPEQGEPVLIELTSHPGLIAMRAHYALKAWREGTLKFP